MLPDGLRRPIVVDASVGIKWFLAEEYDVWAEQLIDGDVFQLNVPELFVAEIGNTLWKRCRAGLLKPDEAKRIIKEMGKYPLKIWSIQPYAIPTLDISLSTGRTYYDSLYLALAISIDAPFVTADKKLWHNLQNSPLAKHVCWIEDIEKLR